MKRKPSVKIKAIMKHLYSKKVFLKDLPIIAKVRKIHSHKITFLCPSCKQDVYSTFLKGGAICPHCDSEFLITHCAYCEQPFVLKEKNSYMCVHCQAVFQVDDYGNSLVIKHPLENILGGKEITSPYDMLLKGLFLLTGIIAKINGKIENSEIEAVKNLFTELKLSDKQKEIVKNYFRQGKTMLYNYIDIAEDLNALFNTIDDQTLNYTVFHLLLLVAIANGDFSRQKQIMMKKIAKIWGISKQEYEEMIENLLPNDYNLLKSLKKAYTILNISQDATKEDIKKAYHTLLTQYHPDKIASKDLPQDLIEYAHKKTLEIKKSYHTLIKYYDKIKNEK